MWSLSGPVPSACLLGLPFQVLDTSPLLEYTISDLQDALEAANSSPGVVFLPAGTYLITAPLVITGSNVTLRGEGVSSPSASRCAACSGLVFSYNWCIAVLVNASFCFKCGQPKLQFAV